MAGSKANRHATKTDTLISVVNQARQARGLDRHRIIPRVSQLPSGGGAQAATGGVGASGNFLDPVGDTMIGPIAFSPVFTAIDDTTNPSNPSMDIGINSGDYSTYVQVTGDNEELRTIFGASFNGQLLYLQYTGLGILTIKQGDGTDGGNIVTNTGGDLVVNFGEVVIMLFDPGGGADPSVNGAWRVVAGGGSGGGGITQLGDLTDVNFPIPLVDDQVLTFNGSTLLWENKAFPSGGMATDLSNMATPTVPTVPLNMNVQDIDEVNTLDFANTGTRTITSLSNLAFFQTNQSINSLAGTLLYQVNVGQEHFFTVGGANGIKIDDVGGGVIKLDLLTNDIINADTISFAGGLGVNNLVAGIGFNDSGATPFMQYNVPDTVEFHRFEIQGNPRLEVSLGGISVQGTMDSQIVQLNIGGSTSLIAGRMRTDGTDTFIFSGGAERNISDIGQANLISQGNTSITITDTGQGSITTVIDGSVRATFSAVGLTLNAALDLGLNAIDSVNGVFPNNNLSDLGSATRFWGDLFVDRIVLENTNNEIIGETGGLTYQSNSSGTHVWRIGASIPAVLGTTLFQLSGGVGFAMSGQDITGVRDFTFASSTSTLDMNGGRTDDCGTITMRSGNLLNMNGGDIINVDDMFVNGDLRVTGETEMDGDLNHDGSRVGFFGESPNIRRVVLNPQNTTNNELFTRLNDLINALGTLNGFGLGLVDTQN